MRSLRRLAIVTPCTWHDKYLKKIPELRPRLILRHLYKDRLIVLHLCQAHQKPVEVFTCKGSPTRAEILISTICVRFAARSSLGRRFFQSSSIPAHESILGTGDTDKRIVRDFPVSILNTA